MTTTKMTPLEFANEIKRSQGEVKAVAGHLGITGDLGSTERCQILEFIANADGAGFPTIQEAIAFSNGNSNSPSEPFDVVTDSPSPASGHELGLRTHAAAGQVQNVDQDMAVVLDVFQQHRRRGELRLQAHSILALSADQVPEQLRGLYAYATEFDQALEHVEGLSTQSFGSREDGQFRLKPGKSPDLAQIVGKFKALPALQGTPTRRALLPQSEG